jgi:peptidoglycan DL-endopeptidase CwlO
MRATVRLLAWISMVLGSACARGAVVKPDPPPVVVAVALPGTEPPAAPEPLEPRGAIAIDRVLAASRGLVGATRVEVDGVAFRFDCSGFVRGVFSTVGLDLLELSSELPGANGVALIHTWVARHGENHARASPSPGDIVYFDDTYDRNRDGRLGDVLTHVGVVDGVEDDGTVLVIHHSSRGIVRDPMNVARPDERTDERGRTINALIRSKAPRDPPGTRYLAGALFAGYGTVRAPSPRVAGLGVDVEGAP